MGILYCGSKLVVQNDISAGDLMSFLVTSQTIQRSLAQLSLVFGNAIKGYTSVVRLNQVILKFKYNYTQKAYNILVFKNKTGQQFWDNNNTLS